MSVEVTRRLRAAAVGVVVAGLLSAGCSSDDGGGDDDPTPVGGINGPARVDPDSGGADNNGADD